MPNLVEIGLVVLEKNILKFCQCIFTILKLSPLRNSETVHLKELEFPLPQDDLCQVWLKPTSFLKFVIVFSQFRNYLPLEKD